MYVICIVLVPVVMVPVYLSYQEQGMRYVTIIHVYTDMSYRVLSDGRSYSLGKKGLEKLTMIQ